MAILTQTTAHLWQKVYPNIYFQEKRQLLQKIGKNLQK
jgi:hypothetical protein